MAYISCRVAGYSLRHFPKGKVSGAAIKRLIVAGVTLDFVDALSGSAFGIDDVAHDTLNVRYNDDRDVAVIVVADVLRARAKAATDRAGIAARASAPNNAPALATDGGLEPTIGGARA